MPFCINTPLHMRDRVRDKVPDKVRDKLLDKQLSGKLSRGLSGRLSGSLSARFAEIYAAKTPSRKNTSLRVVSEWFGGAGSEWFPSGFRVVSEWFPSGFRVVPKTCPGFCPGFWAFKAVPRVVRGFVRGFGFWALSCPDNPGFVWGFVPGFWALKAVRRVVRKFVQGPAVWTQNMKAGVYAAPPLSNFDLKNALSESHICLFQGVLADVCAGLAILRVCAGASACCWHYRANGKHTSARFRCSSVRKVR